MAFDVSSHPVDVRLIQSRLLPYIRGDGDIADLVADAVRLGKVRFRANSWGLGVLNLQVRQADGGPAGPRVPDAFDSDLHVWGRPFFVTAPPDRVSAVVDRYLAAAPDEVDEIAADQLRLLSPALAGAVEPDADGTLPDDAGLADGFREELDVLRASYPNLKSGKPVRLPGGESADPEDLFLYSLPLAVLAFAAQFRPGWMARGPVWFTEYVTRAGLDGGGLIETAAAVYEPLLSRIDGWAEAFERTVTQNYAVGGYVSPANVPAFRGWWEANRPALLAPPEAAGDGAYARVCYDKILESLRDAEGQGFGFLEAAEVYSGPLGIMN